MNFLIGACISPEMCTNQLIFGKGPFFHSRLSEYANQFHIFINLNFFDATFLFSIYPVSKFSNISQINSAIKSNGT